MICPTCHTRLYGLALWCHVCGKYLDDMGEMPKPPKKGSVTDTRSEAEIRMAIRRVLELKGFDYVDTEQGWRRDGSTRVDKGFPDLLIFGHGLFAFAEIKSATGRQSPDQRAFQDRANVAGIPYLLWRHESDAIAWADGVLAEVKGGTDG